MHVYAQTRTSTRKHARLRTQSLKPAHVYAPHDTSTPYTSTRKCARLRTQTATFKPAHIIYAPHDTSTPCTSTRKCARLRTQPQYFFCCLTVTRTRTARHIYVVPRFCSSATASIGQTVCRIYQTSQVYLTRACKSGPSTNPKSG